MLDEIAYGTDTSSSSAGNMVPTAQASIAKYGVCVGYDSFVRALHSAAARSLLDYVLSKRKGHCLASRRDIDPAELIHILPYVFLYSYDRFSGDFYLRLAGEEVLKATPGMRRGLSPSEFLDHKSANGLLNVFGRAVNDSPRIVHVSGNLTPHDGLHAWTERLVCPLADDGETVTDIIGVTIRGCLQFPTTSVTLLGRGDKEIHELSLMGSA